MGQQNSAYLGGPAQPNNLMPLQNNRGTNEANSNVYKMTANGLKINTNQAELDFSYVAHQFPRPPGVHQTISQTPRLKASTFRSPILAPIHEPVKRANSLLDHDDHDLAFMNTSGLNDDQDELSPRKLEGSEPINELEMDFGQNEVQNLPGYQENQYNVQDQLGLGEPLDVADNFPYGRHRSSTFAQPLANPLFNGLGATPNAQRPREQQQRPRNSFDMNDNAIDLNPLMNQQGYHYMPKG